MVEEIPPFWLGTQPVQLLIDEVPESRWHGEHVRWDQLFWMAQDTFHTPQPTTEQVIIIAGIERVCSQMLRSRRDVAMVRRLMPMIGKTSVIEAIAFAKDFTQKLVADRLPGSELKATT